MNHQIRTILSSFAESTLGVAVDDVRRLFYVCKLDCLFATLHK